MKLLLLGATGNTGSEILTLALARRHQVTAYVRSPQKISNRDSALQIVHGDPFDLARLSHAMVGHDGVLSTLGLPGFQALRPSHFMAESAAAVVSALRTAEVSRLCMLSAAVLFPGKGLQYGFFKWLLRHHARDLEAMETIVAASDLEWTLPRPPRLIHSLNARYLVARDALPAGSAFSASFRGVASFMLDAVEQGTHVREIVGLASPRPGAR